MRRQTSQLIIVGFATLLFVAVLLSITLQNTPSPADAFQNTPPPPNIHLVPSQNLFVIYIASDVDISLEGFELHVANGDETEIIHVTDDFNGFFQLTNNIAPAESCFIYEVQDASPRPVLPSQCNNADVINRQIIAKADQFWYDTVRNQARAVGFGTNETTLDTCPAASPQCTILFHTSTPIPTNTPSASIPSPTVTNTTTATSTLAQNGNNIIINPSFEGNYIAVDGNPNIQVAPSWQPWHLPPPAGAALSVNLEPDYRPAPADRVRSGLAAQEYNTFYATHIGGVFQRVSVAPGDILSFSAFVYPYSSADFGDPDQSIDPQGVFVSVGIDPNGGTDGTSNSIIWSTPVEYYDEYRELSVSATAVASSATVFVRSSVENPTGYHQIFVDDAALSVADQDSSIPATDTAPTLTPSPTELPSPTMATTNTAFPLQPQSPFLRSAYLHPNCDWQGFGGNITLQGGVPGVGLQLQVTGDGISTSLTTLSGTNTNYGTAGWEIQTGSAPTSGRYVLQVFSADGTRALSPQVEMVFPGTCEENLAFVNFMQVASLE